MAKSKDGHESRSQEEGHPARRGENTSGFRGASGADAERGIKSAVGGMEFHDYVPGKPSFRGDENSHDYNHKKPSKQHASRHDESFKDTGKDATSAPVDTNVRGILGNTKNVPRDPGKSGKNRTPGFEGHEHPEIAKARRGGLAAGRDTEEKGVGHATDGGILGNTQGVARNPEKGGANASARARNVEGFNGARSEGNKKTSGYKGESETGGRSGGGLIDGFI